MGTADRWGQTGPVGQSCGWYQDPDDPTRLRHWGGRGWSGRRRRRPAWELSSTDWVLPMAASDEGPVLEGPVRPAELHAIAIAVTGTAEPRGATRTPVSRPRRSGHAPGVAGPSPYRSRHPGGRPAAWAKPGRPVMLLCLLATIALLSAVVSISATGPSGYSSLVKDQSFVRAANSRCNSALAALRVPGAEAITATGPPSLTAVRARATGIDALANQLQQLPLIAADRSQVQGWLADWRAYSADELAYATPPPQVALPTTPGGRDTGQDASQDPSLLVRANAAANGADRFALDNGLVSCTLAVHPAAASSPQPYA